jgi:sialate O-acetylesterase
MVEQSENACPMRIFLCFLALSCTAHAELRLPAVISDHMVMQANTPVDIWGWAEHGDTIAVNFANQTKRVTVDESKRWQVKLDPMPSSAESRELGISSSNQQSKIENRKFSDVLVGEVWLASGQSNMEMQIQDKQHGSVDNADEEIAKANHPAIRLFVHDTTYSIYETSSPPESPIEDRPGKWIVCSPQTVAHFTAIGFFFARDLHQQLGVPVGILSASVGGTPIEAWASMAPQQAAPTLKPLLDDWSKRVAYFDPENEQRNFNEKKKEWLIKRAEAVKKGDTAPKAPTPFKNQRVMKPGSLFNGVIAPLVPYTIRGCIWYQGERNAAGPFTSMYGEQLKLLVADWRTHWGNEFYLAWVQLPGFSKPQRLPSEPNGWGVAVREGQLRALSVPRTGLAITIDLGGENAGHPTNKTQFAERLSTIVLHVVYEKNKNLWTGPLFREALQEGDTIVLSFDHAAGLKASSGELQGFAIAGSDQKFVWAQTKIDGEKFVVWSDSIMEPAAVRYGWAGNPTCNLINLSGFSASPFRTDNWK